MAMIRAAFPTLGSFIVCCPARRIAREGKPVCRWFRDPDTGKLDCVWLPEPSADEAEPNQSFAL